MVVTKRKITFRKRLPLNEFFIAMTTMTQDVSIQFDEEKRIIAEEPTITKETWMKVGTMQMQGFKSFKAKGKTDSTTIYVLPSSKCDPENANEIYFKHLIKCSWDSFDEFIKFGFQQFWKVNLAMKGWNTESTCTCPIFFKHYMCKRVVIIALKNNLISLPEIANPVFLANRRKGGAPQKSRKALENQPNN